MRRLASIVADWTHVGLRWPRSFIDRTPPDSFEDGDRTPVVLLPGIWEPWRFLLPLAKALHAAGHPIYPVPALGLNGAPLEKSVDVVAEALSDHHADSVMLVAHSKGGLIGKQLMLHGDVGGRISGLVAVCSPFGGSSLSIRALSRTPLGLFNPGNDALVALAAEQQVNSRIVSIGSVFDEVIPNGTHLDGATNHTVKVRGHFRPLVNAGVQRLVVDEVARLVRKSR